MPWGIIGVGAASGIANYFANKSANDRAEMLQDKGFQQWMALQIPDPDEQKVALQRFVSEGSLVPKLQNAIKQDPSAFEKIVTDAGNKAAQGRALGELENIGNNGGLRLQDKAALQDATLNSQVKARADRLAINEEMARRGTRGSGFEVASQLAGQQGDADRQAKSSLSIAASAQDRALQAIQGAGDLATKYRTQDFGEQAQKATAADRINQFNTQNLRDVNAANVGMQNRDTELNLANKQDLSNKNTALSNSEQTYNKGLAQQQFENQAKQAAGASGQANTIAGTEQRGGQILGNAISNVGGAATGALSAQSSQDFWDNYFKKKNGSSDNSYSDNGSSGWASNTA